MSQLDVLLNTIKRIAYQGVNLFPRPVVNFVSLPSGSSVVDNPTLGTTDVTIAGASSGTGMYGSGVDGTATCDGTATVPGMSLVKGTAGTVGSVSGSSATVTGLANITFELVGKSLTISGAATSGNNGTFVITQVLSSSSVVVTNASADSSDGNNGSLVWGIANVYVMTRDVTFAALTVNSGIAVNTIGFRIFTQTFVNNGHVHADGAVGAPTGNFDPIPGGGGQGFATLAGGSYSWGGADATPSLSPALGGVGGVGGSSASVPGTVTPPSAGGYAQIYSLPFATMMLTYNNVTAGSESSLSPVAGGTGGGIAGGGLGPSGGSGGGVMVIVAGTLAGSGSFTANGGVGAPSSGDGAGGGGGGGVIVFVTRISTFSGTVQVNGGAAGDTTGGGGDQTPQPGGVGTIIALQG